MNEINEKSLFLVFINYVGVDSFGFNNYEFLFSDNIEDIEGENWGFVPACNANIQPPEYDKINLTATLKTFYVKFNLIKDNTYFSMWDCMSGIIPLIWEEPMLYDSYPTDLLYIRFGETLFDINTKFSIWSNTEKGGDKERNEQILQLKY